MVEETKPKVVKKKKKPAGEGAPGAQPKVVKKKPADASSDDAKPKVIKKKKPAASGADSAAKPKSIKKVSSDGTSQAKPKSVKRVSSEDGASQAKPKSTKKMNTAPPSPSPRSSSGDIDEGEKGGGMFKSIKKLVGGNEEPPESPSKKPKSFSGRPPATTPRSSSGDIEEETKGGGMFKSIKKLVGGGDEAPESPAKKPASFKGGPSGLSKSAHQPKSSRQSFQNGLEAPSSSTPQKPSSILGLGGSVHPPDNRPQSMRMPGRGRGRGRGRAGRGRGGPGRQGQSMRMPPPPGSMRNFELAPARPASMTAFGRNQSRDSMDGPPRSRADSSGPGRGKSFRGSPNSILRNSSHHHTSARVTPDGTIQTAHSSDSLGDDDDVPNDGRPVVSRLPSQFLRDMSMRSMGEGNGGMDASGHSFRTPGSRRTQLSRFTSARSVLTLDMEYGEEPKWKQFLRYIRILAPHPNEKPIKKKIRIITWAALVMDFLAALVSITTYDGVTYCCGVAILSIAGDINWNVAIQMIVYVYMALIFVEILPVVREGFPFHLVNPFIGFLITFAVFFDDRITEAVIMWIIEAGAILCEFLVYRLKVQNYRQRDQRLQDCDEKIKELRQSKRNLKNQMIRQQSGKNFTDDDSSGGSFGDDFHDETDSEQPSVNVSTIRETKLLRERRVLRQSQAVDAKHIYWHLVGVGINITLGCLSLLLIIMIGRSGGLCVKDMILPNIFKTNQLEKCFDCVGTTGPCEVCREDGTSHCYYPYY